MTTVAEFCIATDHIGSPPLQVGHRPHNVPGSGDPVFRRQIRLDEDIERRKLSPSQEESSPTSTQPH